ncbi:MAG: cobyrinate a,c-diamide synthase, partial [Micromonosporaceae bacterium]
MTAIPRLVIAAPSSGHGKTAVSVGLLAAFAGRGLTVTGFKIGPDYVDAGYLGLASGRPGRNLDSRLQGVDRVAPLFAHGARGSDIALVEGAMGLYDDLAGRADGHSTAEIAGLLKAPVVLVLDVGSIGQSVGALVHGFRSFDELLWLGGVILTGVVSDRHEQILRGSLDDLGVPVLGVLRRRSLAPLPARQMGVAPVVDRGTDAVRAVRRLGSMVASCVELERMVALARSAPDLNVPPWSAADALAATSAAPTTRQLRPNVAPPPVHPVSPAMPPSASRSVEQPVADRAEQAAAKLPEPAADTGAASEQAVADKPGDRPAAAAADEKTMLKDPKADSGAEEQPAGSQAAAAPP